MKTQLLVLTAVFLTACGGGDAFEADEPTFMGGVPVGGTNTGAGGVVAPTGGTPDVGGQPQGGTGGVTGGQPQGGMGGATDIGGQPQGGGGQPFGGVGGEPLGGTGGEDPIDPGPGVAPLRECAGGWNASVFGCLVDPTILCTTDECQDILDCLDVQQCSTRADPLCGGICGEDSEAEARVRCTCEDAKPNGWL